MKKLAAERSGFARSALFDRVAGLLFADVGELSTEVRTLIDLILGDLIHQVEADVRKRVSERLAPLHSAPPGLVRLLAADDIDIAAPVLMKSPVLSTADLLEIVNATSAAHREVIAMRANVPADVVQALVSAREPQVIRALLSNAGAVIPRAVFLDIIALAQSCEMLCRPLVERQDIPKDLFYRLYWMVSASLRNYIIKRYPIAASDIDGIITTMLAEREIAEAPPKAAASTWRVGEVSALVARARAGDIPGFTQSLAVVTGVSPQTAALIVADAGGEPLIIACKAAGASRQQAGVILSEIEKARLGRVRNPVSLDLALRAHDALPQDAARAVLRLWTVQKQRAAA